MRSAARSYFSAFGFILANGLGWAFLVPPLIGLAFLVGSTAWAWELADWLAQWAAARWELPAATGSADGWDAFWRDAHGILHGTGRVLLLVVLKVAMLWLFLLVAKYVVLVLMSPVLAYVSERAETRLTGRSTPFRWARFVGDTLRGATIALLCGVLEVGVSLAAWILTLLFPPLAPFTAAGLFVVSSYFYGFNMFDYVAERRETRFTRRIGAVNARARQVVTIGALFNLTLLIPFVGLCVAPAMGAVGAVMAWREGE
ncbi:MAG: EI24 domain-containing protein [Flavobacteriales bacterium]|nr:EI24 domain-containing protein [Flavobacteriales bacterium]